MSHAGIGQVGVWAYAAVDLFNVRCTLVPGADIKNMLCCKLLNRAFIPEPHKAGQYSGSEVLTHDKCGQLAEPII